MKKSKVIFMFFYFLSTSFMAYGQSDSIFDWQEQILSRIDAEEFSEYSYARLVEMLSDLELSRNDTVFPSRIRQDIIIRGDMCLNIREGFHDVTTEKIATNKAYRGDPVNHSVRYKLHVGDRWAFGFVLGKDAGESFRHRFPMYDSYSCYLSYKPDDDNSVLRNITAGNYRLQLGSGLLVNQQFSLGKNIMSEAFMLSGTSFSAHSSTDDYNYMQGVIADIRLKDFRLIPFVSYKQIDAAISNDTITSIPTDGLHRTINEVRKRHTAAVLNTGLHLSYSSDWYELGANLLYTGFSLPYFRTTRAYNIYYYRGKTLLQGSAEYHLRRYGFELRGETAFDQDFNLASINQISHSIGEDWKAGLSYRYYSRKYQSLYASSVSESSSMQGEQGAMFSLQGSPFPHWNASFSIDYFDLLNIPYGYKTPVRGFDLHSLLNYSHRFYDVKLSYRLKSKKAFRHNLDAVITLSPVDGLKLKTQIRTRIYSPQDKGGYSVGYAVAQSLSWNKDGFPLNAEIQGAWFDASDYDTRIYLSEKNILYGFGLPMLYGKGMRGSMTCIYKIRPNFTLDLKYSLFHYLDRNHISNGLQQIWGADQYNLWLQLRLKL